MATKQINLDFSFKKNLIIKKVQLKFKKINKINYKIDLIKIDVNDHGLNVTKSLIDIIKKNKPALLVETDADIYPIFKVLKKIGYKIEINGNSIMISPGKKIKPTSIKTGPWPKFATDNMPIILAVLTKVSGKSVIEETVFSNRFMAVPELKRMGAKISIKKNRAFIIGQKKLNAADCISSDLRTTFSIILGAISAEGSSTISRIYHGLRGYENLQIKIKKLGIKIKLKK